MHNEIVVEPQLDYQASLGAGKCGALFYGRKFSIRISEWGDSYGPRLCQR